MRVELAKITSAVGKVSALTSDIKSVPGVLLNLSKDETDGTKGLLEVCFSDGHKSVIEIIDVEIEETDYIGGIVVDYNLFTRAIANCQPSGIIKVSDITFEYKPNNIVTVNADQFFELRDGEGNVAGNKKMASKKMDIAWVAPGSDMKSSILSRMKYHDIFEAKDAEGGDIDCDVFDRKELIDALARTSVEKGKQIYFSAKSQNIFVANQAHLTSVPVSGTELSQEDRNEIAGTLSAAGTYSEESFKEACDKAQNRIHYSISISQTLGKAIIDVLSKTSADTVNVYTKDKCCNIFIESEEETVGLWFEMTPASKTHLGAFERYNVLGYTNYQLMFIREFLVDMIKSAANATKSEKVELKFLPTVNETPSSPLDMVINGGSAASSTSDTYVINPDSLVDANNDLQSRTFKISISVLAAMLAQIKTARVALDFNVGVDGSVCLRLSEIDDEKLNATYMAMRNEAKAVIEASGQQFDMGSTPTPAEIKAKPEYNMRNNSIIQTRQYTMLSN